MTKRKPKPYHRLPKLRRSAKFDTRKVWGPPSWVEEHEPIFHYIPNNRNKRDAEWRTLEQWQAEKVHYNGRVTLDAKMGWTIKTPCGLLIKNAPDLVSRGVEFPMGHALQIGRLCRKCFPGGTEAEKSWPTKDEIEKTTERLLDLQRMLKKNEAEDG